MRIILSLLIFLSFFQQADFRIPVDGDQIVLTEIGEFGIERVARPGIPAHLHTGIDIRPPNNNYTTREAIYPVAKGVVISKRTDGPFAQLIIEHDATDSVFWSVYEHIAEIEVDLFQPVDINTPLARFFNAEELNKIGWQFNHFHFEILKGRPLQIKPNEQNPERLFNSYTLMCHTKASLNKYFYNPIQFLSGKTAN